MEEENKPQLPFKTQMLMEFPGLTTESVESLRWYFRSSFAGHGVEVDSQRVHNSSEALAEEVNLRSEGVLGKLVRGVSKPIRPLIRLAHGTTEESHLRHTEAFRALAARTLSKAAPKKVAEEGSVSEAAPTVDLDTLSIAASEEVVKPEVEPTVDSDTLSTTVADEVAQDANYYPEHLLLVGQSRGADQSILAFINMLYAEALAHQDALAMQKPEVKPFLEGVKKLSIIVDDPVGRGEAGDRMSDEKRGEQTPLSEKLKFIKAMAGEDFDIDCTIITTRISTFPWADFTKQWADLRDDETADVNVVYAGFEHTLYMGEARSTAFLSIDQPTEALQHYTSDPEMSHGQRMERLKALLLPYLADDDKISSSVRRPTLAERRTAIKEQCSFDLGPRNWDLFHHLINQRGLKHLMIYAKLGYVSEDLLQDFVKVLEQKDLQVTHVYTNSGHNVDFGMERKDTRYRAASIAGAYVGREKLIRAKQRTQTDEGRVDHEKLAKENTQTRRQAFGKARFRRKR